MLSKEELLTPRFICTGTGIHHYPGSPFLPGDILTQFEHPIYGVCVAKDKDAPVGEWQYADKIRQYPHLFRIMEWWEDRAPDEMPEYEIVIDDSGTRERVHPVYETISVIGDVTIMPATEEEYNAYINKAK